MVRNPGVLTISLDFELYWGVRDKRGLEEYRENLLGVREAVPGMLQTFGKYGIHATWAAVGFLFFRGVDELKAHLPDPLPTYAREGLSPYRYIAEASSLDAACHFAPDLIGTILAHEGQEIGTHTFSHYYCLEQGQSPDQLEADIARAVEVAERRGLTLRSLVFPRNQWNAEYLAALNRFGLRCYRGNEPGWIYRASDDEGQGLFRRALRLADAYVNLSGPNTWDPVRRLREKPADLSASRFLRPYSRRLAALDGLRLRRIRRAMDHAAVSGEVFHLWWHPHNFGIDTGENLRFLERVLEHYARLKREHGMQSLNMGELCRRYGSGDGE